MTRDRNHSQIGTEEIFQGFLYSLRQLDANTLKVYEASSHLYALIELLAAKGIIELEELEQPRKTLEQRLRSSFQEADIGVRIQESETDKYNQGGEVRVECEKRVDLCGAACCKVAFPLSLQDIEEGLRWNLGKPFLNARGDDGYCAYLERQTLKCSIYERRPATCRSFDCRNDRGIWLDFGKMVVSQALLGQENPYRS
jgi:hypothetical protein